VVLGSKYSLALTGIAKQFLRQENRVHLQTSVKDIGHLSVQARAVFHVEDQLGFAGDTRGFWQHGAGRFTIVWLDWNAMGEQVYERDKVMDPHFIHY